MSEEGGGERDEGDKFITRVAVIMAKNKPALDYKTDSELQAFAQQQTPLPPTPAAAHPAGFHSLTAPSHFHILSFSPLCYQYLS